MPAKSLYSLSDEHPELQKQIGCMNGLFQLFDRHHFLGGRRIICQNQKRLPPPAGENGSYVLEPKTSTSQKKRENNLKKINMIDDKQKASTESSRNSFSSSTCSSSFTSSDCNRTPQNHVKESSIYGPNASLQLSRQSPDLRDVVKDSIYREGRGLSIKTTARDEAGRQTLKYMDSPRPLQSPNSAKSRVQSFRGITTKLQEAPSTSNERRRDGSLAFTPKDAPRYSYDERVSQDAVKMKLKELPRLSLDSRQGTMKGSINGMKSNTLLGDFQRRNADPNGILNQQQEPGSYRGPSSVVAKLMGLEVLPDSMVATENQKRQIKSPLDVKDESKKNRVSGSPRISTKEASVSPRLRKTDSGKKPIASKCPLEPAPWRQPEGSKSQTPALKCRDTQTKAPNNSLTVYGEIEKRLAQLEFKKSGKDLRALKQILEAMQKTKQMFESRKEDQASAFSCQTETRNENSLDQSSNLASARRTESHRAISPTIKGASSPRSSKSPIVTMKPAKLIEKACVSNLSVMITTDSISGLQAGNSVVTRKEKVEKQYTKDLTPRPNHLREPFSRIHPVDKNSARALRFTQTSLENLNSSMSSETRSLKLQQKKLGFEKQSRQTTPTSEPSRTRRQPSRQQTESGSPRRKPRHRSHNSQSDDQMSDISSDIRDLSHQGDASSMQSESNSSLASIVDNEVTSTDRSVKTKEKDAYFQRHGEKQKNLATRAVEDGTIAEPRKAVLEQPSPVSVLDATFYEDEAPSPVKKISIAFQEYDVLNPDGEDWSPTDPSHLSDSRKPDLCSNNIYRKAENFQQFVQKLLSIESACEKSIINQITPFYNSKSLDHKYISEILFASGLLRELESSSTSFQLPPSAQPIDPQLFLALEQTKACTGLLNVKQNGISVKQSEAIERDHRKLIFDAVNEILASKLAIQVSSKQWLSSNKLADERVREQLLLRDLCSEIDRLQAKNSNCSLDIEDWTYCQSEVPWIVLDIERLIFKDLICEVISSEAAKLRGRMVGHGHCRQLFSN